jgi:hypothetical protein
MAQMKNTIYNFSTIQKGDFIVQDYSRNNFYKIRLMPEVSDDKYIMYIELEENQTIEAVSYLIYGDENYWDMILSINGIDPLFDMFYSNEVMSNVILNRMDELKNNILKMSLTEQTEAFLENYISVQENNKNDTNRTIKVIKPSMLQDFIRILRDSGYIKN